jgi:hypothetical protein
VSSSAHCVLFLCPVCSLCYRCVCVAERAHGTHKNTYVNFTKNVRLQAGRICWIKESLYLLPPCIACDYSHPASVNSVTYTSVAPIAIKRANGIVWKRKVNWINVVRSEGDEDHEILSPLRRFTVVRNEEGEAFLEASFFPHDSLPSRTHG